VKARYQRRFGEGDVRPKANETINKDFQTPFLFPSSLEDNYRRSPESFATLILKSTSCSETRKCSAIDPTRCPF
jgi:hypothetical protein